MTKFKTGTGEIYMADDDDNKCAHEICDCRPSGDAEYCSDYCRDADDQDLVEIACGCGHPSCS